MASRLNRPGDFQSKNSSGAPLQLLPPSSFKPPSPSPATPSHVPQASPIPSPTVVDDGMRHALQTATQEIATLKLENAKLREAKAQTMYAAAEEIKARVDLHQRAPVIPPIPQHTVPLPSRPLYDVTHYDDIINRQAAEIANMKKQLQSQETESQKTIMTLETKLLKKEAEYEHELSTLKQQAENSRKNLEQELYYKGDDLKKLSSELTKQAASHSQEVSQLKQTLVRQETELQATINDLQDKLAQLEQDKLETLDGKDSLINQHSQRISQLMAYISENEESARSTDIWRKDVETLKHKIQKHEKEQENLQSTIQLLHIRLSSQNKILTVQENELAKDKADYTEKNKFNLLSRWREKVYELLVQQKCAAITQSNEERQWRHRMEESQTALREAQSQIEVLKHSLEDRDAQLEMQGQTVKHLEDELTQAQELVLSMDEKNKEDRQTAQMLADFAHSVYGKYQEAENLMLAMAGTIKHYNQRIAFASGRVEMLQSQFARREAHLKLKYGETVADKPTRDTGELEELDMESSLVPQLQGELERVTQERDHLAMQLKEDALLLEGKIVEAREKYADEVNILKQRIGELHEELENKKEKITQLNNSLDKHLDENARLKTEIDNMEQHMAKQQEEMDKAVEEQRNIDEEETALKLTELDKQLNDARREHAKAVVSCRQLERQIAREKDRMSEYAHSVEQHYTSQCSSLEERLRSSEKERNLLMATIRQEGLLSKVKSQRHAPALLELDETGSEQDETQPRILNLTQDLNTKEEPLHAVIDDLRSLTAAVLDDNGLEDEDEEDVNDNNVEGVGGQGASSDGGS